MKLFLLVFLLAASVMAQVPAVPTPPVYFSGSAGPGGKFPFFNNGSITMADADYTMVVPDFTASVIAVQGTLTASRTLYAPATRFGFEYTIINATAGNFAIVVKPEGNAAATGVTIPNGQAVAVIFDGTNYVSVGSAGSGGVSNANPLTQGTLIYGNGTTTVMSATTELSADAFPGTDSGTQVNNAIAALPSTGGTIRLSCRNYAASSTTITISVNNVTLQGCGSQNASVFATGGTTLNFAAGVSGIVSTGANTQIRDLMVVSADTTTGSANGISLGSAKPILWNVGVRHFGGVGIIFNNNTDRWNMTNVESSGNFGDGFRFTAVADDNLGVGQNLSAVSNGGIGYDILGGGANVFQLTHAANNTGGAWFVHAVTNFFLNTYIELGTGSSFIFDTGINWNTVEFASFGLPSTYTDGGTNVRKINGLNDALALVRPIMANSVSGTDTIVLTTYPPFTKQTQPGLRISFVPAGNNATTAVTLAVNGLSALPVQKNGSGGPINLAVGDLVPSIVATLSLDPTVSYWILSNPATAAFVGGVPGINGDLLFSSGFNTLFADSGNAYYDLPNKVFYVPSMRLNSATDGYVSYVAGTGVLSALAANSMGFSAPPSGGTPALIRLPGTVSAGAFTLAAPATINGVSQSQASVTPITTIAAPNALVKTDAGGAIDPSFTVNPSKMILEDNFCGGLTTNGNIGQLAWTLITLGGANVLAGVAGTYPYLCQLRVSTVATPTQGQGAVMTVSTQTANQPWADFSTNTNWSTALVFQLGSTTSDVFYFGLGPTASALRQSNMMMLRHDTNSPISAEAILSVVCTTTYCTVTLTAGLPLLVGQGMTISGESCPTRNVNGTNVITWISGSAYRFNQSGAAETCTIQGTATSVPETNFQFVVQTVGTQSAIVVDSGVAADTNFHKIRIYSTIAGIVNFQLDGNAPVTISTNLSTVPMLPIVAIAADATTQKSVTLNYFNFLMTGLPR